MKGKGCNVVQCSVLQFLNMFTRSNNIAFCIKAVCCNRVTYNFRFSKYGCLNKKYISHSIYSFQIHRLFITSSPLQNLHTVKGWKTLARDGFKDDKDRIKKQFLSCEEGTNAVFHDVLMSQLQGCNTVSDQIKTFCSSISIPSKDVEIRKEFCKSLTGVMKPYFPKFKLHLFGSTMNGLGFKGCDVDVSIQTMFGDNKEYVNDVKQVPTLDSVINGEVSPDIVACLPPVLLLRLIRRILRAHCPDVQEPIFFIKARCPLLRFYNAKYDVFCDFSCENYASLRNTKLIRILCHLDDRFSILTKILRYWGKYGGFVGDIDLFNSYSFSLLVVHFLQLRNPPVLPHIKDLIEKSEYLMHGDINDNDSFCNDLKKFEPSKNTQTVEELLREFFFHFLTFDFSQMMLPLTSSNMAKVKFVQEIKEGFDNFEFSTVTVQDPFRLNFNVTSGATYKTCRRFLNSLVEACKAYQDEKLWHPSVDKWGVCSLFQRLESDSEMFKKLSESNIHSIKLPLNTNVSLVTKILHEGLLFDCNELITENSIGPQPSLKLNCKVYYNTWVGRNWICENYPSSFTNQLQIENWVSNKILKDRGENKKQLLFTFLCECFENTRDKESNVILTFQKSKYPPVVAIFLKEYIPVMCKKLAM